MAVVTHLAILPLLCLALINGSVSSRARTSWSSRGNGWAGTSSPWVVTTPSLPSAQGRSKALPTLANGVLALTVTIPTIRQSCLYNGRGWTSHRARIPGYANYLVVPPANTTVGHLYSLDYRHAVFHHTWTTQHHTVSHSTLVHKLFTNSVFNTVTVAPLRGAGAVGPDLSVELELGEPSLDLRWGPRQLLAPIVGPRDRHLLASTPMAVQCGRARVPEQQGGREGRVCVAWSLPGRLAVGDTLFHTVVAKSLQEVKTELAAVRQLSLQEIVSLHSQAWEAVWREGSLQVDTEDLDLQQVVVASQFYLLSSLPPPSPAADNCGLSPGSLAYGGPMADYEGHSFWDTEVWMLPALLLLHPPALALLDYRVARLEEARALARASGHLGARYPWESALTGREVCPEIARDVREQEVHVSADISLALRLVAALGREKRWWQEGQGGTPCRVAWQVAQFWVSRAEYNISLGAWEVRGVMGPDEDHSMVDNNGFTNAAAQLAIRLPGELVSLGLCKEEVPRSWSAVASGLLVEYDETRDFHPQYSGYTPGTRIKQADAVLLGYPLNYPMADSTRRQDLELYGRMVRESGPAMTWSMHAIGWLQLGEEDRAEVYFNKSYQPYVTKPFGIWTEAREPDFGAVNFLTGMGGFLQGVLQGYLGIRTGLESLQLHPRLPRRWNRVKVRGLHYQGAVIHLVLHRKGLTVLEVVQVGPALLLQQGGRKWPVIRPGMFALKRGPFSISLIAAGGGGNGVW